MNNKLTIVGLAALVVSIGFNIYMYPHYKSDKAEKRVTGCGVFHIDKSKGIGYAICTVRLTFMESITNGKANQ